MSKPTDRALVLFSGGQDSATCLADALQRYQHVETVGFEYGQSHPYEMQARVNVLEAIRSKFPAWSKALGEDHVLSIPVLGDISDTALTRDMQIAYDASGVPNTFVPGRNLLFLTLAAALAYRRGISVLIGGMCETDFSGYPDCRNETLRSQEQTLSLGMGRAMRIETPLMWLDKAATWALADKLGGNELIQIIIEHSHTCYRNNREQRQAWGYGCGACPACELRARGFQRWQGL